MRALASALVLSRVAFAGESVVRLPEGTFAPLFGLDVGQKAFPVAAFRLDVRPVTRAEFAAFLAANPQWKRERAPPTLVHAPYPSKVGAGQPPAPGPQVS